MAGVKGRSGGHNARSASEHRLSGTFRSDRHGSAGKPQPPLGMPIPPKRLQGDARLEWDRMLRRLGTLNTLSPVDDGALYQYCQLFAETESIFKSVRQLRGTIRKVDQALRALQGEALLTATAELTRMRQLEVGLLTRLRLGRMALRVFLAEFGLVPATRSRVKTTVAENHDEDPWTEFDGDGSLN